MSRIDENRPFVPVNIAVLTVSDSRTVETDTSGKKLEDMILADGHKVAERSIVTDDGEAIVERLRALRPDLRVEDGRSLLAEALETGALKERFRFNDLRAKTAEDSHS